MKVVWSSTAVNRFNSITKKMVIFSPDNTAKFIDEVFARAEGLAKFPDKGRIVKKINDSNIRELIFKNYRIIYYINRHDEIVTILTMLHTSQNFPETE